jgi:hypothetical protein
MTQYDAGPGDWSDREWEDPDRKPKPQAKRRLALPPWALIAGVVAIAILLCVGGVLIVRAIRSGAAAKTPKPRATFTAEVGPTATVELVAPTSEIAPTATVELPDAGTVAPPPVTEIRAGATVVVQGTGTKGLNLRAQPSTSGKIVSGAKEGAELLVLEGPQEADGFTWWRVRAADAKEGWAAGTYLVLKP